MLIVIDYYWKLNYLKRIQKAIQVPTFCLAEDVNFCNKTFFWQIQPQCILAAARGCRTKLGRFPSLHKLNDCFSKLDTMKLSTSVGLACPSLFPRATRTGGPEGSLAPQTFLDSIKWYLDSALKLIEVFYCWPSQIFSAYVGPDP